MAEAAVLDWRRAKTPETRMTLNDFMTGFLAGLAANDVHVVSIRGASFYSAMVEVFQELERKANNTNLHLRFWLTQDELHQDAPQIREGITKAVQRDLISLDNPTFQDMRLKISRTEAQRFLDTVPGGPDLFIDLAKSFTRTYKAFA